jgi:putative DNA modification/repair radical SAM protein
MDVLGKLEILADAAKYDVACTSSGVDRKAAPGQIGSAASCGICHSFAADGRCISLLKVLMSNYCAFDCRYCVNRRSNDVRRAAFSPREIADLTMQFYRRNYIEGLFLSSAVERNPDYATEQMIIALRLLRKEYRFAGYIHVKGIPGTDKSLLASLGLLADRISINIELPSQASLSLLAPDKSKASILDPMGYVTEQIADYKSLAIRRPGLAGGVSFAPAGQSTQMIIGATPDSDLQILRLSESLYRKYRLKRVFYSAYMPVVTDSLLPAIDSRPPLLREHRLYQADWLLRFYGFAANELLSETQSSFNPYIDPKCNWALNNPDFFPVEINTASREELLRVPGIGITGTKRILAARRQSTLTFPDLQKLGVILKRAQYFVTCGGKRSEDLPLAPDTMLRGMISERLLAEGRKGWLGEPEPEQLSYIREHPLLDGGEPRWLLSNR